MTTYSLGLPEAASRSRETWTLGWAFVAATAVLVLLFRNEAMSAVATWMDSTAYNHCFFVVPIALWLAWDRRSGATGVAALPTFWPVVAMVPLGLGWFAAERLGIMEGRQLAAVMTLQVLLVALLGWRLARVFAGPIAYLVFLVPFGGFLTPMLQVFTAQFVDVGLTILDVPHVVTKFIIEIPEGRFFIAEACAGLRFLIAAIAFGGLYVLLLYRSPVRRILFMIACLVVPVIANGFRALGIVMLGHFLGSAKAAETDHIIYGWGFFSVIILLLTAAGLPFREDDRETTSPLPAQHQATIGWTWAGGVAVAVTLAAAIAPIAAAPLARSGRITSSVLPAFRTTTDCPVQVQSSGAAQTFRCGRFQLVARHEIVSSRIGGSALKTALRRLAGGYDAEDAYVSTLMVPGRPPQAWHLVEALSPPRMTATLLLDRGRSMALDSMRSRLLEAWNSVFAPAVPLILASVTLGPADAAAVPDSQQPVARQLQDGEKILLGFLAGQTHAGGH